MGFKVDIKELTDYQNDVKRNSSAVKGQIENAIQSMRAIPSSQAMEGNVGMAVSENISSNHIPSLIGLKSSYDQLAKEVEDTLNDFKSSTGESSGSAVITEDVLTRIPGKLDNLLESYTERTEAIKGIYTEISDLVSLTLPKSNLAETINDTKKHVKKIQTDVSTFENGKTSDSIDTLLSQIESQIGRITSTKSLGYGSPEFLSFSMRNEFVSTMAQAEKAMIQQEKLEAEEIRKQKAEDWNRLGPQAYYMKYPEDHGKSSSNYSQMIADLNANDSLVDYTVGGLGALLDDDVVPNQLLKQKYSGSLAHETFSNLHINNVGTPIGSLGYLGSTGLIDSGAKYLPYVGTAVDIWSMRDDPMGAQKVTGHIAGDVMTAAIAPAVTTSAVGVVSSILVTGGAAATLPVWGTVAIGVTVTVAVGTAINYGIDSLIDWFSGNK